MKDTESLGDAYTALLWLYRRLPEAYYRVNTIEQTIKSIACQIGADPTEYFKEREKK